MKFLAFLLASTLLLSSCTRGEELQTREEPSIHTGTVTQTGTTTETSHTGESTEISTENDSSGSIHEEKDEETETEVSVKETTTRSGTIEVDAAIDTSLREIDNLIGN